jgi:hypothetical protein
MGRCTLYSFNLPCLLAFTCLGFSSSFSQTVFLDFNTTGQYTNNFDAWNGARFSAGLETAVKLTSDAGEK